MRLSGVAIASSIGVGMSSRRTRAQEAGETYLYVEAESAAGQADFEPFEVFNDSNASSGSYIEVPNSEPERYDSPPTDGRAAYEIDVPTDSDYTLWLRGRSQQRGNSFYIAIDSRNAGDIQTGTNYGVWDWYEHGDLSLSAGTHTIEVIQRESGMDFDRLLLTSDLDYEPSGTGGDSRTGDDGGGSGDSPSGQSPFGDSPIQLPGRVEAEDFDDGGEVVAYEDTTDTNRGDAYRDTAVDIESTSDDGGGYNVGWMTNGEWLEYSVDTTNTDYRIDARLASRGPPSDAQLVVKLDGVEVTRFDIPDTDGWQNWTTESLESFKLAGGERTLRLEVIGGSFNVNWVEFIEVDPESSGGDGGSDDSTQSPYGGSALSVPGRVEAENFDDGGSDVTYTDSTDSNLGGAYRDTAVDIEATNDDSGYNVGWMTNGEWLEYTISAAAGTYDLDVRVASRNGPNRLRALVDGSEVGTVEVPDTGGWQNWTTVTIPAVDVTDGEHVVRLEVVSDTNFAYNVGWFRFADSDNTDGDGGSDDGSSDTGDDSPTGQATVAGTQETWHRTMLTFDGPDTAESTDPNPFLDYRLQVLFEGPSGQTYDVPGYYAGDGSGGASGNKWRVHFAPDEAGEWSYATSFREGSEVAIDTGDGAGTATTFDGISGTVSISGSSASGRDFRESNKGLLANRGGHYLRFDGGDGDRWVKGGPNIPENFLAHDFDAHDGRRGTIDYIANRGANSIYFLPNNANGDGDDTWPHTQKTGAKTRYDTSKLAGWRDLFEHAQSQGVFLHFQLAETESENENYYDNGNLGPQRKLFYRELVARFGHVLGIEWDLGEENDYSSSQHQAFADYIHAVDPYDHPVTTHTRTNEMDAYYDPLLGDEDFEMTAMQTRYGGSQLASEVDKWRDQSASTGVPWVSSVDEPQRIDVDDLAHGRIDKMWPTYMGGGGGFEWYVRTADGRHSLDQDIDDYGRIESALEWTGIALDILGRLPLEEMVYDADGVSGDDGHLLAASDGSTYAVYLPTGDSVTLDLASGSYSLTWYNPRTGASRDGGTVDGSEGALGSPPIGDDVVGVLRQ